MFVSTRALSNPPSGIRAMFAKAAHYDNVLNLGIGEPDFPTPMNIRESAINALKKGLTKYTPNAGILDLRNALMGKLARENGLKGSGVDNIIVTTGACEAITLSLFTVTDPGDEVIVPVPSWSNYMGQVHLAGAKAVPVATFEKEKFHITVEAIKEVLTEKTKVLVLNTPSNPTGAVLSKEELIEIGRLAKKHNFMIISDEPYEKFIYGGRDHVSIGSLEGMEGHVLTVNSFSKTYSMTGWRVGYVHGSSDIVSSMVKLQENFSSCVNTPSQYACIDALNGSQDATEKMFESYVVRRNLIVEGLNSLPEISCLWPEGSFYAFPNISRLKKSSEEVAIEWLEKSQVVTVPGTAFGAAGEGFLRLSFAASVEVIEEAIERLKLLI